MAGVQNTASDGDVQKPISGCRCAADEPMVITSALTGGQPESKPATNSRRLDEASSRDGFGKIDGKE
jgi:hypothetical protein